MPKRLIFTIVCFHISAAISLLIGIAILVAGINIRGLLGLIGAESGGNEPQHMVSVMANIMPVMIVSMGIISILFAGFIELVIRALNRREYWAWVAGIVIAAFIIISGMQNFVGLALGGLSLWGLVDPDSVAAFKAQPNVDPPSNNINTDDRI